MRTVDVGFRMNLLRSLAAGPRLWCALGESMAEEYARKHCAEADDLDLDDDEFWPADEDEYIRALQDGHEWFARAVKEAMYLGQVEAPEGGRSLTLTISGHAAINAVAQMPLRAAPTTGG